MASPVETSMDSDARMVSYRDIPGLGDIADLRQRLKQSKDRLFATPGTAYIITFITGIFMTYGTADLSGKFAAYLRQQSNGIWSSCVTVKTGEHQFQKFFRDLDHFGAAREIFPLDRIYSDTV